MLLCNFLIERLSNAGVKHVFGVPGDCVLEFYNQLWKSKDVELITNTDEAHSGFAADAYARISGIGCVVVTYGVGASKVINAVQCAYAERSPLIVISGAAGIRERDEGIILPHVGSQKAMFDKITCASIVLDNQVTAGYLIDSAFETMRHYKQPIYIELPRDMVTKSISYDVYKQGTPTGPESNKEELTESLEEVELWVKKSSRPVIVAGVELARCQLGEALIKFAERNNIPLTTTLLSKSVVSEMHPLFSGIYCGDASKTSVKQLVENSDCLLMLGVLATDNIPGSIPLKKKKQLAVAADIRELRVRNHVYANVKFMDFCKSLFKKDFGRGGINPIRVSVQLAAFSPEQREITTTRLFEKINTILDEDTIVVCDQGDCMYGAADLVMHSSHRFLCPAFYTSMGVAVPGALGVMTASPTSRVIAVVGDGAAQMSLLELSTILNRGLNPVIIILNNDGYLTERLITDGDYNNIRQWDYHKITDLIRGGTGYFVSDEMELDKAVDTALASKQLSVINVKLAKGSMSEGLKRVQLAMVGK